MVEKNLLELKKAALFLATYLGNYPENIDQSAELSFVVYLNENFKKLENNTLKVTQVAYKPLWNSIKQDELLNTLIVKRLKFIRTNEFHSVNNTVCHSSSLQKERMEFVGWLNTSRQH